MNPTRLQETLGSGRGRNRLCCLLALVALVFAGCARRQPPPNIIWIVWDTVRADRMSLYGYSLETTPHLDRLSGSARVFDAAAVSCWTLPSHASMFTGLYPGEHGVNSIAGKLDARFETVADILSGEGYETYLFSANPFISSRTDLSRGFQTQEHPDDEALAERARTLLLDKMDPADRGNPIARRLKALRGGAWFVKAVGELANERFLSFLDGREAGTPFFGFLNYMEAHRIRVPPRRFLERVLGTAEVDAAYAFDRSQKRFQGVSLGLADPFSAEERTLIGATYDATILELDALLAELFEALQSRDLLEDTVIVLTSDHGEQLGERGSYLHQYSLDEDLLSVPLVLWAPGHLTPGREPMPVSTIDLFPTLLEIAGVDRPAPPGVSSLLGRPSRRPLVAEYIEPYEPVLKKFEAANPEWDSSPFRRSLRSLRVDSEKLVWSSTGPVELHDLGTDGGEDEDLAAERAERSAELAELLRDWVEARRLLSDGGLSETSLTEDEKELLRSLGYL